MAALIAMTMACASCASSPVSTPERIESANGQSSKSEKPQDLIADTARIREFNVFPDSISASIDRLYKKGGDKSETYHEIQKLFCNSNQPKLNAEFRVEVLTPQRGTEGTPTDQVVKSQKEFLMFARRFLAERFFISASYNPVTKLKRVRGGAMNYEEHNFNQDYVREMMQGDSEYGGSLRDQHYFIPYMRSPSSGEIQRFYSRLPYLPDFQEKRWLRESNVALDEFFFTIISGNRSALLVPKAIPYLAVGYDDTHFHSFFGNDPAPRFGVGAIAESSDTLPALPAGALDTYYHHGQVMTSEFGWKLKDHQPIYPLQVAYARDLSFLVEHYTFVFSSEILKKEFRISDPQIQQHYGIGYESHRFEPSNSIENKGLIWNEVMKRSTSLKEAARENAVTEFTVTFDPSLFCRYGTPLTDLEASAGEDK